MLELFVNKNEMVELSSEQIETIIKIVVLNANKIDFIGCSISPYESEFLPIKYTYQLLLDGINFKRDIRLTKNEWRSLCAIHQATQLLSEENYIHCYMVPYNEKYYRYNHPLEYARKHWIEIIKNECEQEYDIHRIVLDVDDNDDKIELCVIGPNNDLIFRVTGLTYGEIENGLYQLNYRAVTVDCWIKKN